MFPKVSTCPLDMEYHIREYMDDIAAEEWCEGYLDKDAFLGSYCYGLIWLRCLSPFVISHELIHHINDSIKIMVNECEKFDIVHYLNDILPALRYKNYYVFYHCIKEIRKLLNFKSSS